MRLLPGQPADLVGQSITGYALTKLAINNPDILPRIYQAFSPEEYSPISSMLAERGYFTKGLREGAWTQKFRPVASNHVMYRIASSQKRKILIAANDSGITYSSSSYASMPGYRGTPFFIYTNNNWARPNEIIELNDNKTQLHCYDQSEPTEFSGVYRYEVRLMTNDPEDYCDPTLLEEGSEAAAVMTAYEHDFSETGSEKYTFDGWGHTYMTLQRVKMSTSGTAEAMESNGDWYKYDNANGKAMRGFIPFAYKEMLRRAVQYHEYQLIFGKTTVTVDGQVFLHDKRGREIMTGSGLLYGGDGAYERPLTRKGWTMKFLESILRDADIRSGKDGHKEMLLVGGFSNILSFNQMMKDNGFKPLNNYVDQKIDGSGTRGVNMDYDWFQMMDIRIIPKRYRYFDSEDRPQKYLSNGDARGSWDSMLIPMGFTTEGDNMLELVQLRAPILGTVHGMDKGGDNMASSVDGKSVHYLWQTGVVSRTNIHRIFMSTAA